ncbi:Ecm25p [Saccharomyces eubayanus]|uniref:Ecm25p n=1 Tax=Saccharomyces eubayanus TaxID=1080349 RepID=UPI0006C3E587|nr:ECM25-like protein [Saccharomyces eubayanus]KOG98426.1 ECM25-like protein [Saccharomyces eubayanus]
MALLENRIGSVQEARMIDINVNNIFFRSYSVDPNSGHAIYVFDSTYLPAPDEIGDKQVYDLLINALMDRLVMKLPQAPYSLVIFSSGFSQRKISWVYGIKMFAKLPKETKFYLQKIFIVHESFFVRSVYQVLSNAMNFNFLDSKDSQHDFPSLVHVLDLTSLSELLDITRLRISLNVYLYDYQISERIDVSEEYYNRLTPLAIRQYRQLIFDKIFKKLQSDAVMCELIFQKPGNYKKVNIFLDIIKRNNYIDLSQWDIYSLASVWLNFFIKNKAKALIPIELIPLPIVDDFISTRETFHKIIKFNQYQDLFVVIFPFFNTIIAHGEVTRHDSRTLSKALTPALCKEKLSIMTNDRLAIGSRYIKNLLDFFPEIVKDITSSLSSASSSSTIPLLPKPRKSSPTRYSELGCLTLPRSRSPSPQRSVTSPIFAPVALQNTPVLKPESSNRNVSSPLINTRPLPPPKTLLQPQLSLTSRSNTDLTLALSSTDTLSSPTKTPSTELLPMSNSSTDLLISDTIKEMVKDEPVKDKNSTDTDALIQQFESLAVEQNSKIKKFDKELQEKKRKSENTSKIADKFSQKGYSDIKAGNKVSRLAALYEERLQGLQVMNEMKQKW